ncbi:MAG: cation:proton antiporter [Rhodothermales bacterium]
MSESILIGIVSVIVLGIGAQWLAWRLRIPSILLLLVVGFTAGPVTGLLAPESLQGDWLFAFVSLSIGIILFEGGLSLRISELREIGAAVLNLITIGVLVTWALAGIAAYYLLGFNPPMSALTGAIVTVTGPTVIVPLLRHVRPKGRISKIAKWEGITIDPVGAVLAVLVLETILLIQGAEGSNLSEAVIHAIKGLMLTIATSVGIGVIGAGFLVIVLYRRLVPDFLRTSVALMLVVGTFALSNALQAESGLLEVTLMGIILANQKFVDVRRIIEFKEDLQVLLIASLFILLSARLDLAALQLITWHSAVFLAILIVVVRPIAVFFSTQPTKLDMKEKIFLSWLAPRGIVAAAVSSLFAFRLEAIYPEAAAELVPLIFLVIVGTVAIYGLTISPIARYLGLADPNPQGVLILGAHPWARQLGKSIRDLGFKVMMIDTNPRNIRFAGQMNLDAVVANALSEAVLDELDLSGLGKMLALTPNDEINSLATLNFLEIFESTEVYQLAVGHGKADDHVMVASHLRGNVLFGGQNFTTLTEQYNDGGKLQTFEITAETSFEDIMKSYDDSALPLVLARGGDLLVSSEDTPLTPAEGDRIVLFVQSQEKEKARVEVETFDQLLMRAHVLDLDKEAEFSEVARQASALLATRLPISADKLATGFLEGARFGAAPIANGFAIPHFRLPGIADPELVLVRCKEPSRIDFEEGFEMDDDKPTLVNGFFFLVSPQSSPGTHLRVLAQLAGRIDDDDFLDSWMGAPDHQRVKETLIAPGRYVSVDLSDTDELGLVGSRIEEASLPNDSFIALVGRGGELVAADPGMVLRESDRVTIVGKPDTIARLAQRAGRSGNR